MAVLLLLIYYVPLQSLLQLKKPDNYLFSNKILRWIGKRSYSIYLYHIPIFLALEGLRQPHNKMSFLFISLVRLSLSIILAALSYQYIEQPILRFKKKFDTMNRKSISKKATLMDVVQT